MRSAPGRLSADSRLTLSRRVAVPGLTDIGAGVDHADDEDASNFHDLFTDDHPGLLTLAAAGFTVVALAIMFLMGG